MRTRFGREYDSVARDFLMPRARAMRIAPTRSEHLLWQQLRGRALGVRFRRQVILGRNICDFFAPSARLVVEVDGAVHAQQRDYDRLRDEGLAAIGIRTLRIPVWVVERDVAQAVALVRRALAE
jgi:very-short-patch-repair endonuclease